MMISKRPSQAWPLNQFHDVGDAPRLVLFHEFNNVDDVGVVDVIDHFGLVEKPREIIRVRA